MKKGSFFLMLLCLVLALSACRAKEKPTILVPKAENLAGDFIMGADVSTLLTQEASGAVSYDFEGADTSMWRITQTVPTTDFQNKKTDAYDGNVSLHFWNAQSVDFTVEQDITGLRAGNYTFSIQVQGGDVNEDAQMYIYAISDGQRYEQPFMVDGWVNWQNPVIENIPCTSGSMTIGVCVQAAGGVWGTMDHFLLNPAQ